MTDPTPTHEVAPFDGGWGVPDWPDDFPSVSMKRGRRMFQVAARLEPKGDLHEFATAMSGAFKFEVTRDFEGHPRSLSALMYVPAKTPAKALSRCGFYVDRALRKTGWELVRISWDACEVPANEVVA